MFLCSAIFSRLKFGVEVILRFECVVEWLPAFECVCVLEFVEDKDYEDRVFMGSHPFAR